MSQQLQSQLECSDPDQLSTSSDCQGLRDGYSDGVSHHDPEQPLLIPGLPNDISLFCLARLPRKHHATLKCVSKMWRDLVGSEEWYAYRQKHQLEDSWIYALCRSKLDQLSLYVLDPDQLTGGWKRIQGLPSCYWKRKGLGFEVLGKTVYLSGGCGWIEDATSDVYSYDAGSNSWSQAAPLSVARCYFACQAVGGKIFAIGGIGPRSCNPQSYDTYDPLKNCWTSQLDPNVLPDIEDSVVLDGKIYVRCSSSAVSFHAPVVVYDPSNGTLENADPDLSMGWKGPSVVVDGTLFVLNQSSGTRLMMWQKDTRQWVAVGRFSSLKARPPCQLVSVGKKIYIIGKGLSTMIFDTENVGNGSGLLLSSSVQLPQYDAEVIICRSLAI